MVSLVFELVKDLSSNLAPSFVPTTFSASIFLIQSDGLKKAENWGKQAGEKGENEKKKRKKKRYRGRSSLAVAEFITSLKSERMYVTTPTGEIFSVRGRVL